MLGGEKKEKKVRKRKATGLKKEADVSGKVNLKVKIHQPEIKKKSKTELDFRDPDKKRITALSKALTPKASGKKVVDEYKNEPGIRKIKTDAEKSFVNRPVDEYKVYRQKQTIMWSGIAFFMILIVFVWTYNIKKTFKAIESKSGDQSITTDLDKIGDELSAKMKEMKENLEEIKAYGNQMASSTSQTASSTSDDGLNRQYNQLPADKNAAASSSSSTVSDISREELDELKAKLIDLENKINEKK